MVRLTLFFNVYLQDKKNPLEENKVKSTHHPKII